VGTIGLKMDRNDVGSNPHVTLGAGIGFCCAQNQTQNQNQNQTQTRTRPRTRTRTAVLHMHVQILRYVCAQYVACSHVHFICNVVLTGAAAGCDTLVRRFFSVETSGVHLTACSVPTPTPGGIVTPTSGGTCFCWSPSLTAMPIAAYPSAADDEAVVLNVVAGSAGSRASGSHGPLDLDPAPCGGAKGGGKGKEWDMQGMQMALSASAVADDDQNAPKGSKWQGPSSGNLRVSNNRKLRWGPALAI
jgi:hypothetical protein